MKINFATPADYNLNNNIRKNTASISFNGLNKNNDSFTVEGSETKAKVYTQNVDYQTISQIKTFCNHPVFSNMPIRIMPDTHAGLNSVVGFSAPINPNGSIIPNIIGGDIGCGMLCVEIDTKGNNIDFKKLDDIIKTYVSTKRTKKPKSMQNFPSSLEKQINSVYKNKYKMSSEKAMDSLATLGGGNHFIEIDEDNGKHYLVIHTGSRLFGRETAEYHEQKAEKQNPYKIKALSYLSGDEAKEYLEDMRLAVKYSQMNRRLIADEIISKMGWEEKSSFECIHNYISDEGIIRKGAINADIGKEIIIPLNMRDGAVLGRGKGNSEWNNTAPHGAGRKYNRSKAKEYITFDEYQKSMKGIYSSCISEANIDEAPQAYKDAGEIIENIDETVDIQKIITPVYNYKD